MNEENTIILLDEGDVFEGSIAQFEDCFFSMPKEWAFVAKIAAIRDFAEANKFRYSAKTS